MKKIILIIVLLYSFALIAQVKKIGVLKGDSYFKIPMLLMDNQKIFVVDKALLKGFIYDRKTLEPIAEFGGKGEAPSEFLDSISSASMDDKFIYVSCFPKLCIFTKDGKFVKEFRVPLKTGQFQPLGNNRFLATYYCYSQPGNINIKLQYQLFDNNILFKKDFFTAEFHRYFEIDGDTRIEFSPSDYVKAVAYKNKIYFGNTAKGFYFAVYDRDGKQLYEIKLPIPKVKISSYGKKVLMSMLRSGTLTDEGYTFKIKNVIRDEYPAYRYFFVNDDRIYVFTHMIDWKTTIYILDLKGVIVKKKEVIHGIFPPLTLGYNSYIDKGKLIYLKENPQDPDAGTELYEFDLLKYAQPR